MKIKQCLQQWEPDFAYKQFPLTISLFNDLDRSVSTNEDQLPPNISQLMIALNQVFKAALESPNFDSPYYRKHYVLTHALLAIAGDYHAIGAKDFFRRSLEAIQQVPEFERLTFVKNSLLPDLIRAENSNIREFEMNNPISHKAKMGLAFLLFLFVSFLQKYKILEGTPLGLFVFAAIGTAVILSMPGLPFSTLKNSPLDERASILGFLIYNNRRLEIYGQILNMAALILSACLEMAYKGLYYDLPAFVLSAVDSVKKNPQTRMQNVASIACNEMLTLMTEFRNLNLAKPILRELERIVSPSEFVEPKETHSQDTNTACLAILDNFMQGNDLLTQVDKEKIASLYGAVRQNTGKGIPVVIQNFIASTPTRGFFTSVLSKLKGDFVEYAQQIGEQNLFTQSRL